MTAPSAGSGERATVDLAATIEKAKATVDACHPHGKFYEDAKAFLALLQELQAARARVAELTAAAEWAASLIGHDIHEGLVAKDSATARCLEALTAALASVGSDGKGAT